MGRLVNDNAALQPRTSSMRCTVPVMVIMGFRFEGGVCLRTNFLVGPVNNGGERGLL